MNNYYKNEKISKKLNDYLIRPIHSPKNQDKDFIKIMKWLKINKYGLSDDEIFHEVINHISGFMITSNLLLEHIICGINYNYMEIYNKMRKYNIEPIHELMSPFHFMK